MHRVLRYFMLLALVVWVGGIIFFSFVEAPVLFMVLPERALAGEVVGYSLELLHWMGLIAGVVFLLCSLFLRIRTRLGPALIIVMMALIGVSQFVITPRIERARNEIHSYTSTNHLPEPDHAAAQAQFNRLHNISVGLEGAVLLLGLIVLGSSSCLGGKEASAAQMVSS